MSLQDLLMVCMLVISILLIITVILQPSQKTGLMGDATDVERRDKRGFELFLFRSTIVLIVFFIAIGIAYGAAIAGLI